MPKKKEEKSVATTDYGNIINQKSMGEIPGLEGIDSDMLIIPRVKLVQGMSVEASDGIAPAGSMVNSITKNILAKRDESLSIVPLMISRSRLKFKSIDDGGGLECRSIDGFEGTGNPGGNCFKCPLAKWEGETPPKCMELINVAVMPLGTDEAMPLILSFGKTSFAAGRMFVNMMALKRVSPWNFKYKISGKYISDAKGKYFVFTVSPDGEAPKELSEAMESFYQMLKTTAYEVHEDEAEIAQEQANMDEDTPF